MKKNPMSRFQIHDELTAPEGSVPVLRGALATGGDLVFYGEGNGMFRALHARTGQKLWEFNCGAGANAMPVSYTVAGKQYVAMGCGGNTQLDFKRGNTMVVFALE